MIGRFAAGAAIGTAVVLSATGCLGDGGGKTAGSGTANKSTAGLTAADVVNQASQKTGQITSFQATLTSNTEAAGQRIHMDGTMNYRSKPSVAFKMNVPKMVVNGQSRGGFQEIFLKDTLYMKMPALSARSGKPWVRMSLSKMGAKSGVDLKSLMDQAQQSDPASNVKMLTASKDVRKIGQETVGGVTTTHYQGTYPVQQALAKLNAGQRAKMQQMMGQMGIDKMSFDLWVDGQNLPRKVTVRTPAGAQVTTDTTIVYTGFNTPFTVTAPPASQVASAG